MEHGYLTVLALASAMGLTLKPAKWGELANSGRHRPNTVVCATAARTMMRMLAGSTSRVRAAGRSLRQGRSKPGGGTARRVGDTWDCGNRVGRHGIVGQDRDRGACRDHVD